jgi:hypothetical protein
LILLELQTVITYASAFDDEVLVENIDPEVPVEEGFIVEEPDFGDDLLRKSLTDTVEEEADTPSEDINAASGASVSPEPESPKRAEAPPKVMTDAYYFYQGEVQDFSSFHQCSIRLLLSG